MPTDPIFEHTSPPGGIGRGVGVAGVLARLGVRTREIRCGRFRIIEKLGDGGMGTVYRAHDPTLDRFVAIKVLHEGASADRQRRLRREAHALARLSHPNVVGVLGVGNEGGETWIAMELVEGRTLADWLTEHDSAIESHATRALQLIDDAGRGLAAAHRAGLVHRDVKPANIFIATGGTAKVGDFGLAVINAEETTNPEQFGATNSEPSVTRFGGTPLYMAPEQHIGGAIDAKSDQFGLAATAWELLEGTPPFRGRTLVELAEAKLDGRFATPGARSARIQRVLVRALRPEPDARFATVDAFLEALRLASRRRRVWPTFAVLLCGLGGIGFVVTPPDGEGCQRLEEPVWDDAKNQALRSAFTREGAFEAPEAWSRIASAVDEYTVAWARTRDVACSVQPPPPSQVSCLQRSSVAFSETLERLSADSDLALNALASIESLPDPTCSENDPATTPEARAVLLGIAELRRLNQTGDANGQRKVLARTEALARRLNAPSILARLLESKGAMLVDTDQFSAGIAALEESYGLAVRARDDRAAMDAAVAIVDALHRSDGSLEARHEWLRRGRVAHERDGATPSVAAVWLYIRQSDVESSFDSDIDAATLSAEEALRLANALDPATDRMVYMARAAAEQSMVDLGIARGAPSEVAAHAEAVVENTRAAFGAEHPQTLDAHYALVDPLMAAQRHEEALVALQTSQRGTSILHGPRSISAAALWAELSRVQLHSGLFEDSRASAQRCIDIVRELDTAPWLLSNGLSGLMLAQKALGDFEGARKTSAELITLIESSLGPDHLDMALAQHNLGDLVLSQGDVNLARTAYQRSLEIAEANLGDDSPNLTYPLGGLAESHLLAGDAEAARGVLDRARGLQSEDTDRLVRARLDWTEARLIVGEDPDRAVALARDALGRYRDGSQGLESTAIESWLAAR